MASIAQSKKTDKANLEQYRIVYFQIGLIITLGLILAAFEYKTIETPNYTKPVTDSSDFYVAKEVFIFKPISQNVAVKAAPPKTVPKPTIAKKALPIVVKPVVVPPIEIPPPAIQPIVTPTEPTKANDKPAEALPPNTFIIDKQAQFPGGALALNDFVLANLQYPEFAKEKGYSGTVVVQFIIEPTGQITNITVSKTVRGSKLDEEAVRIVKLMPTWEPAIRKGQPIRSMFTLPVEFRFN